MIQFLRTILREVAIYLGLTALFSSFEEENEKKEYPVQTPTTEEYVPAEKYVSSFYRSEYPISLNDLTRLFSGLKGDEFATLTVQNSAANENSDTLFFDYRILYGDALRLNEGIGFIVPIQNEIQLFSTSGKSWWGYADKIVNIDNNTEYTVFYFISGDYAEMMFINYQLSQNSNRH